MPAQSASVTRPETLHATLASCAERTRAGPPRARARRSRIGGLARWSMTKRTSGMGSGRRERRRQLARPDQQVVDEPGVADRRDPAIDVGPQEPLGIGLVVDLVADPDEPRRRPAAVAQPAITSATAGIGQVDPADDAGDERGGRGSREELAPSPRGSTASGRGRLRRCRPRSSSGARSSGPNGRRIAASSSVSHG